MFGSKDKNLTPFGGYDITKLYNFNASIFRLSHPVEEAHYTYVFVLVSTFEMVPHIYTSFYKRLLSYAYIRIRFWMKAKYNKE